MIPLIPLLGAAAHASGLLLSDEAVVPLQSVDVTAYVAGRITAGASVYSFDDASGEGATFVAALPTGAAVIRLSLQRDGGELVVADSAAEATPDAASDGGDDPRDRLAGDERSTFTAQIPAGEPGELQITVDWQVITAATRGALSLTIPLDDASENPTAADASVAITVAPAAPLEDAALTPEGALEWSEDALTAGWSGTLDDADAVALSWTEQAGQMGVLAFHHRPAVDPWTGIEGDDGYTLLVIQPGADDAPLDKLFTFVIDTSDSMAGAPLAAANAAAETWLPDLAEDDRFNLIPYASQAHPYKGRAPQATDDEIERALEHLADQEASGLSDPEEALRAALGLAEDTIQQRTFLGCSGTRQGTEHDGPPVADAPITTEAGRQARMAAYVVLLTDGGASTGVVDPDAISASLQESDRIRASLFAIGLGADADMELLSRLASEHRGEALAVTSADEVPAAVSNLRDRIRDPLLLTPAVELEDGHSAAPSELMDLSAGHELIAAFRWSEPGERILTLTGVQNQADLERTWTLTLPEERDGLPAVALAWASLRVADLDAAYASGDDSALAEITALVETWGVASEYVTLSFSADAAQGADATAMYAEPGAGCGCAAAGGRWSVWLLVLSALVSLRRLGRSV